MNSAPPKRRGEKFAREWVLACVDGSAYANSVCDHAAWFASDPEVGVGIVHALEDGAASATTGATSLVERALSRLHDEGVGPLVGQSQSGELVEIIRDADASIVVMGKRGVDTDRTALGRHVDLVIRRIEAPICLAPKVFLPIRKGLLLLDSELAHFSALELVATDFRLSKLALDVAVIGRSQPEADAKMALARRRLPNATTDIFSICAGGLNDAVAQYAQSRSTDLIVLSRAIIESEPGPLLLEIEESGLWSTRSPVLIC